MPLVTSYKRGYTLMGWGVFAFVFCVYLLTMERTAGFWDCGEFVLSSYKLQVPHAPGAPFYLLIGRLFSMLAGDQVVRIALFVNTLSALASAFTVLFLFWTLCMLARRMIRLSHPQLGASRVFYLSIGSAATGALSYAFTDTFWSSATEAEVYAFSSLLVSLVVWAALKWEASTGAWRHRWLLFIAYLLGLSLGVHLLALLTIPALCFLFYHKKVETLHLGLASLLLALGILVIFLIALGTTWALPRTALLFDVYCVNTLGLPFNSGGLVFVSLSVGLLLFFIGYTHRKGYARLNLLSLMVYFLLVGYASYALIFIRSGQNPPVNENHPDTLPRFLSYLQREQYGNRPLLYGRNYTAPAIGQTKGVPVYARKKGASQYEQVGYDYRSRYDPDHMTLFPRMYDEDHAEHYEEILPHLQEKTSPSFVDNVLFFFRYQIGHMYMRYFLWNFSGKEGYQKDATWLSFSDSLRKVPASMQADLARNHYYMLPLLLGVVGLFLHCLYDIKRFFFVLSPFLLMGVGLVVYLNMPPFEPRERDYIYAGSFYAFSMWIGLFFAGLLSAIQKKIPWKFAGPAVSLVSLFSVLLLCGQNWDDHDHSARYFSTDAAKNILASCAPHAVLFTGGDNDTFPLWYVQEVEGFRTDVRVVVFSYLNTDWYIDQMMRPVYESTPIPFSLSHRHYEQRGANDFLPVYTMTPEASETMEPAAYSEETAVDLTTYLSMVRTQDEAIHLDVEGQAFNYVPGQWLAWKMPTTRTASEAVVPSRYHHFLIDAMKMPIKTDYLEKKDLAVLDFMHTNQWERPIYFNHTSLRNFRVDVQNHVVQEGLLFRLLPVEDQRTAEEKELFGAFLVDTERSYANLLQHARFRGLDDPSIHYTEDYERFVFSHRSAFLALANALIAEDDYACAREVLLYCLRVLPDEGIPYDMLHNLEMVALLLTLEEREKAIEIADVFSTRADEMLDYLFSLRGGEMLAYARAFYGSRYVLRELEKIFSFYEEEAQSVKYRALLEKHGLLPVDA